MSSFVTTEVVQPYAKALLSIGQSNDLVDRFGQDVGLILETVDSSKDLQEAISNPLIRAELKQTILKQIFGEQIHSYILNFVMLLVDRGRISFLEGVCRQYQVLLRELNRTVLAEVTSTVELSESQQEAIRQRVKDITDAQQVELETKLDPDLIGGVIIKVGSQVIDASLRSQLRRIGLRLANAA